MDLLEIFYSFGLGLTRLQRNRWLSVLDLLIFWQIVLCLCLIMYKFLTREICIGHLLASALKNGTNESERDPGLMLERMDAVQYQLSSALC
jgi:hypothetical protein